MAARQARGIGFPNAARYLDMEACRRAARRINEHEVERTRVNFADFPSEKAPALFAEDAPRGPAVVVTAMLEIFAAELAGIYSSWSATAPVLFGMKSDEASNVFHALRAAGIILMAERKPPGWPYKEYAIRFSSAARDFSRERGLRHG